jgi:acyl transferase domain-containing protein/surfactin synthase thioesterase subunit/acyl carrier protein
MSSASASSAIAIIGIACRLPGARDYRSYWSNLRAGIESITTLSDHELAASHVSTELMRDPSYVKAASLLPDSDCFDAPFFEYSPQETRLMDPQQRLLLEVAWEAFEDAGYRVGEHPAHVGVFVGSGGVVSSYLVDRLPFTPDLPGYTGGLAHLGNDKDFPSTRISYKLNLTGPSLNVQSACSTSLVAVHLACQSILAGECEMALAGAATVRVPQRIGYLSVKGGILSPDGHCRAFDADAQGTIFGSGVALVLLKELPTAIADGDHIYAVIGGSAINNDGADKVSYTASSVAGQARAMVEAISLSGISPDDIGYVECHGTGTLVGDPLEVDALTRAFRTKTKRRGFCAIGSVKTNIGHLEQAAGVASLIKAALALYHGEIPPSLNFRSPNPRIDFTSTPFFVNTEHQDWPAGDRVRCAAVNSLGLGGTNAFVVLQEAPRSGPRAADDGALHLFVTSAKSEAALRLSVEKHRDWLDAGDASLADICFTSTVGRSHFSKRFFATARSRAELRNALDDQAGAAGSGSETSHEGRRLAFVFSGQASQYPRMGAELYQDHEVFRDTIDQCSELLEHRLPRRLKDVLLDDAEGTLIDDTGNTQPALFSVQAALVNLWRSWGIVPDIVMGHSVGEFAASYCAGVYTLEQVLGLISDRANVMQALPRDGAMAAMFVDEQSAAQLIERLNLTCVAVAAANAPQSTVVSGLRTEIDTIVDHCRKLGIECRMLNVSHAFHSPLMTPAAEEFARRAEALSGKAPRIAWVSTLSGKLQTAGPDAEYWRAQALGTVRFAEGVREVARGGTTDVVEIGPGSALLALGQQCVGGDLTWLASLRNKGEAKEILSSLGRIYCHGYDVDWTSFHQGARGRRVSMPTYAFEKRRYWIQDDTARSRREPMSTGLLGTRLRSALPQFEAIYSLDRLPYLGDHRIYGVPVLPLTVALTALREAARQNFNTDGIEVTNIQYQEAMQLPESGERIVQIVLTPLDARMAEFRLASMTGDAVDGWSTHLVGAVRTSARASADPGNSLAIGDVKRRCTEFIPADRFYQAARVMGLEYGTSFQGIQSVWRGVGEVLTKVKLPDHLPADRDSGLHPALLDSCLHIFPALVDEYCDPGQIPDGTRDTYLPIGLEAFRSDGIGGREVWTHVRRRPGDVDPAILSIDIGVYREDGSFAAAMDGLSLKRLPPEAVRPARKQQSDRCYQLRWLECPQLPSKSNGSGGGWLILADHAGIGSALADLLSQQGGSCQLIHLDDLNDQHGARTWKTPDDLVEPFTAVMTELTRDRERPLRGVVDLWPLDLRTAGVDVRDLRIAQQIVVGASVALFKAAEAVRDQRAVAPRIWLASRNAVAALPDDPSTEATSAALWGLGRTAALEYPQLWGGLIDLEQSGQESIERDAAILHREIVHGDAEDQIALRGDRRLGARLVRASSPEPARTTWDPTGAYLITGGLGALGFEVAKWLVTRRGVKNVVLASRRGEEDPNAGLIRTNLETLGAQVALEKVDITIDDEVKGLVGRVHRPSRPLKGIFHCAGILEDGILGQMDWAKFERVIAPKVFGAWLLHEHTRSLKLDQFVLFSSILSLMGSAGQANYAAANAFLDALGARRRSENLPAIVLNFGPWADSGLATLSGDKGRAIWRARGTTYIPLATGVDAIDALVGSNMSHAAITITQWDTFLRQFSARPRLYSELEKELHPQRRAIVDSAAHDWRARILDRPPLERSEVLVDFMREQVAQVLGLTESIDVGQPLRELGLDSLMSVTLINRIEQALGVRIPVTKLIKGPSIAQLVQDMEPEFLQGEEQAPPQPIVAASRDTDGTWLVVAESRAAARFRLFCFPFAGGGSAVFRGWTNSLDTSIEVIGVEPPGRLGRIHEKPVSDIEEFVDELTNEMLPLLDKPFAFFGHCLGGLTMYETARRLIHTTEFRPAHLFASGARPPDRLSDMGLFEERLTQDMMKLAEFRINLPSYLQPDDVFSKLIRHFNISATERLLDDVELRELMLPVIRAEFQMANDYQFSPEPPWEIPITCFAARGDPYVSRRHALGWGRFTNSKLQVHIRPGAHFAVVEDVGFIHKIIHEELRPL